MCFCESIVLFIDTMPVGWGYACSLNVCIEIDMAERTPYFYLLVNFFLNTFLIPSEGGVVSCHTILNLVEVLKFFFSSEQKRNSSSLLLSFRALEAHSWRSCLMCCFKLYKKLCKCLKYGWWFMIPATTAMMISKVAKLQPTAVSAKEQFMRQHGQDILKYYKNGFRSYQFSIWKT